MSTVARDAFVGIDVAFAKKKRLPICVCVRGDRGIEPLRLRGGFEKPPTGRGNRKALCPGEREAFASSAADWLTRLEEERSLAIRRVAIDAPRFAAVNGPRAAEQAMGRRGISYIATPTREQFETKIDETKRHLESGGAEARMPNANLLWMLVGFDLFRVLTAAGYDCIEVYPQAIVRQIGCFGRHKRSASGLGDQIDRFAGALGRPPHAVRAELAHLGYGSGHDRLDAYLSAWVASLDDSHRVACGEPPRDVIWVPDIAR